MGSVAQITVRPPDLPPLRSNNPDPNVKRQRNAAHPQGDWDNTPSAPAYVIQIRKHDEDFADTPTGALSSNNPCSGPQLYGADGIYFHNPARSDYALRVVARNDDRLDYNTLYYVRVGTCLTVDCNLNYAAFTPERSIRTPADPN